MRAVFEDLGVQEEEIGHEDKISERMVEIAKGFMWQ